MFNPPPQQPFPLGGATTLGRSEHPGLPGLFPLACAIAWGDSNQAPSIFSSRSIIGPVTENTSRCNSGSTTDKHWKLPVSTHNLDIFGCHLAQKGAALIYLKHVSFKRLDFQHSTWPISEVPGPQTSRVDENAVPDKLDRAPLPAS